MGKYFNIPFIVHILVLIILGNLSFAIAQNYCATSLVVSGSVDSFLINPDVVVRADIPTEMNNTVACISVSTAGYYRVYATMEYSIGQNNESYFFQVCDEDSTNCRGACDANAGPNNLIVDDLSGKVEILTRDSGVFYFKEGLNLLTLHHYATIVNKYPQFLHGDSINGTESVHLSKLIFELTDENYDAEIVESRNIGRLQAGDELTYKIKIENVNKSTLHFINVWDALPEYISPVEFITNPPDSAGPDTLFWLFDELNPGDKIDIEFVAKAADSIDVALLPAVVWNKVGLTANCDGNLANNFDSSRVTIIPPARYDLSISKTADKDSTLSGRGLNYALLLTNLGPDTASNIVVVDVRPDFVAFTELTPPPDLITGDSLIWNIDTLNIGESRSFQIKARVNQVLPALPKNIINVVYAVGRGDINQGNNADSAVVKVVPRRFDLALKKTVNKDTVFQDIAFDYEIKVGQSGPDTAFAVTVADVIPAEIEFLRFTPQPYRITPDSVFWQIDTLLSGQSRSFKLIARAEPTIANLPKLIQNRSLVIASEDVNSANNADSAFITIKPRKYDLALTKTVDHDSVFQDRVFNFTLRLTNTGPDTALAVVVADAIPDEISFTGFEPAPTRVTADSVFWQIDTLAAASSRLFKIAAISGESIADLPKQIVNTAIALGIYDTDQGNNAASAAIKIVPRRYDLALSKAVDRDSVFQDRAFNFTLGLTNLGPDTALGVVVSDFIPAELNFLEYNPQPTRITPDSVFWQMDTLAIGASVGFVIKAKAAADIDLLPRQVTNTALASGRSEINPVNNKATAAIKIIPRRYNLTLTKTVSRDSVFQEHVFEYSIGLKNVGPDTAFNIIITDKAPPELEFLSMSPNPLSFKDDSVTWVIDTLAINESVVFLINARAKPRTLSGSELPLDIVNTATVSAVSDIDLSDNTASAVIKIVPRRYDLSLQKTVNKDSVFQDIGFIYSISLTSAGPDTALSVVVADAIPADINFMNFLPQPSIITPDSIFWQVDTLAPGQSFDFKINARTSRTITNLPKQIINSAIAIADGDVNATNNSSTAGIRIVPRRTDLFLQKTVNKDSVFNDIAFSYSLNLANAGPDTAVAIVVADAIPADLDFLNFTPQPARVTPDSVFWEVDSLAIGQAVDFKITAIAERSISDLPKEIINSATAIVEGDIDESNNTATAGIRIVPRRTDLILQKTVNKDSVFNDIAFSYSLNLANAGPDTAVAIVVADAIPADLDFLNFTPQPARVTPDSVFWEVDSLAIGQAVDFKITAIAERSISDLPKEIINSATAIVEDDIDESNNTATAGIRIVPRRTDLILQKSVNKDSVFNDIAFSYSLNLTNAGPDTAVAIVVADAIPAEINFLSFSPQPARITADSVFWQIDSLATGQMLAFKITARANDDIANLPREIINSAAVFVQGDINAANNTANVSIRIVPRRYDLLLQKTVSEDSVFEDIAFEYALNLANLGPDTAVSVVIADAIPSEINFLSITPRPAKLTADSVFWEVDSVAMDQRFNFRITARAKKAMADLPKQITNSAFVFASGDVNTTNNSANAIIKIVPRRYDIVLQKTVSADSVFHDIGFEYTLTASNFGPDMAVAVTVQDAIPEHVNFLRFNPQPIDITGDSIVWRIDTLTVGQSFEFKIKAVANATLPELPARIINVAAVDAFGEINPANDTASVVIKIVPRRYDLAIAKTANQDSVFMGGGVRFKIRVTNSGPDTAMGIAFADIVPQYLTFLDYSIFPDAQMQDSLVWQVDVLSPGQSEEIEISARADAFVPVLPSRVVNRSRIVAGNDINPANNLANAVVYIVAKRADLELRKSASVDSVAEGGVFLYTVSVENIGRDVAERILLRDIPSGFVTLNNYSLEPAFTRQDTLFWRFDSLSVGDSVRIEYRAQVAATVPTTPLQLLNRSYVNADNDVNGDNNASEYIVIVKPQDDCLVFDRNIFLPETASPLAITFEINTSRHVEIDLYDVSGYRLGSLSNEFYQAGLHTITWDGRNKNGAAVGSGTYLITFKSGRLLCYKKVIVVR